VKNANARKFDELTYTTTLAKNLRVMDATAISMCRESRIPILVFNLTVPGSIIKAVCGERLGTMVRGD
jgi:uridylate kinase